MSHNIGKNIADFRHQRKMTQEQLAELSDTTVNYLSKIERGVIKNISSNLLAKLANALETSMDNLFYGKSQDAVTDTVDPHVKLLMTNLAKLPVDKRNQYLKHFTALLKLGNND